MATKNNPKKSAAARRRKKKLRWPGLLAWLLSFAAIGAAGYFVFQLIRINILPTVMLLVVLLIVVLLMIVCVMCWLLKTRRMWAKIVMGVIVCALGVSFGVGGYYLSATDEMFAQVTNLTDKQANTVSIYAMSETGLTEPGQLTEQSTLGTLPSMDAQGTQGAIEQLASKGAHPEQVEYSDPFSLVDALYAGEVTAIAFPEQYHDQVYEAANDYNKYNALTTFTNTIDTYIYYTDRDRSSINTPDPVANIMMDPFVVLISGNDSYGSIHTASRSDVNMLVCVNPSTAQILIVSIPRDTYTPITCKKNPTACESVSGEDDKLTHSGIYGVAATESTVEDLLDITINYYVRVNFSSLINIVDAIGGIDVEVEPGLEVDRFYANGTEGVHAGINHLNGERALAFARERYAYVDGDNQRIKNQQIVLKAMIRAMMSPQMVVNYPNVMKALSTAFDTNMSDQEIKSLITLELARFPDWNIQTFAIPGSSQTEYSASLQDLTSVTVVSQQALDTARDLIEALERGEMIDTASVQASLPAGVDTTQPAPEEADPYGQNAVEDPYGQSDYRDPYGQSGYQDPYGQNGYADPNVQGGDYCTLYPWDPACAS